MQESIIFLNENAGVIQAISTVVLVAITTWYATSSFKVTKLMKQQMTPEIQIDSTAMQIELDNTKVISMGETIVIRTSFVLSNKGNGNGSAVEPLLLLDIAGSDKKVLKAKSEQNVRRDVDIASISQTYYLEGGAMLVADLVYECVVNNEQELELFNNLIFSRPEPNKIELRAYDNWGNHVVGTVSEFTVTEKQKLVFA